MEARSPELAFVGLMPVPVEVVISQYDGEFNSEGLEISTAPNDGT